MQQWMTLALKPTFYLGLDVGSISFGHVSLSLQELAKGFKADSRTSEAFICLLEGI
jgi:hypothetical protein